MTHASGVSRTAVSLALQRMRKRPVQTLALALAVGVAATALGSTSVIAALAQEESVSLRLTGVAPSERSLQVRYRTDAGLLEDTLQTSVARTVAALRSMTHSPTRIRIWDPVAPPDERGIRLVRVTENGAVRVAAGRLPNGGCERGVCEVLTLDPAFGVGEVIRLRPGVQRAHSIRIVGRATLTPVALPDLDLLGSRAVVAASSDDSVFEPLIRDAASLVVVTAMLNPDTVHGYELDSLADDLRRAAIRLERLDPRVSVSAPLGVVDDLRRTGRVARNRLLLVAAQEAALILVFAAFVARMRREDMRLFRNQLETLGASRSQVIAVGALELIAPSVVGASLALLVLRGGIELVRITRDLPSQFVTEALPVQTVLALLGISLVAAVILFQALWTRRDRRFGIGALEVAALTGLVVIAWQAATTGALDPNRLATEPTPNPVLILLPALAFFSIAVALLHVLPATFRLADRALRHAPFGMRLAVLNSARNPRDAAAAVTFLAVALGIALFGLNYRSTLLEQGQDGASFQAGARWRIIERGEFGMPSVAPLSRFASVTRETPTPVLRLPATVRDTSQPGNAVDVTFLGLPPGRLPSLLGWRSSFSDVTREKLVRLLRPAASPRLHAPTVGDEARTIAFWARGTTAAPRTADLHFLLPGESFHTLSLGRVPVRWRQLSARLPRFLRGARLVGIGFPSEGGGPTQPTFDEGVIEFSAIEVRGAQGSSVLAMNEWMTTPRVGRSAELIVHPAQTSRKRPAFRLQLNGVPQPLIHPELNLPEQIPALVGDSVARSAVDGEVVLDVLGREVQLRVIAQASLFPTIVENTASFAVVDYDTLFVALNLDRPGLVAPSEAWFFGSQPPDFAKALNRKPFRVERVISVRDLEAGALTDPLAAGTSRILIYSSVVAGLLAVLGLMLATRSVLSAEGPMFAEYEALGIRPSVLVQSLRYRLLLMGGFGVTAAVLGSALAVQLITALVAVTGSGGRPLPPIELAIDWTGSVALLAVTTTGALITAGVLATYVFRKSLAARLRA